MTTTIHPATLNGQRTGIRRELGRYTLEATERILFGQRVDHDTITITDKPATLTAGCRSYTVDALDTSEGYAPIQALVRDYLQQARRTHRIPAARVSDDWLDDLADSFRYDRQRATTLELDAAINEGCIPDRD